VVWVQAGDLVLEEDAVVPAVSSVVPTGPTGAGNREACELALGGGLHRERVEGVGAGVVGVASAVEPAGLDAPVVVQEIVELELVGVESEAGGKTLVVACLPVHAETGKECCREPGGFSVPLPRCRNP
jgi:hypothetical protein